MIFPILPVSQDRLRIVFGIPQTVKKVSSAGLEINSLHYYSEEVSTLCARHKEYFNNCLVKVDPDDLGDCFLANPITNEYIKVPCTDQEYARGRSLQSHQIVLEHNKAMKRDANTQSLRESIFELRKKVEEAYKKKRRSKPATPAPKGVRGVVVAKDAGCLDGVVEPTFVEPAAPGAGSKARPDTEGDVFEAFNVPVYNAFTR